MNLATSSQAREWQKHQWNMDMIQNMKHFMETVDMENWMIHHEIMDYIKSFVKDIYGEGQLPKIIFDVHAAVVVELMYTHMLDLDNYSPWGFMGFSFFLQHARDFYWAPSRMSDDPENDPLCKEMFNIYDFIGAPCGVVLEEVSNEKILFNQEGHYGPVRYEADYVSDSPTWHLYNKFMDKTEHQWGWKHYNNIRDIYIRHEEDNDFYDSTGTTTMWIIKPDKNFYHINNYVDRRYSFDDSRLTKEMKKMLFQEDRDAFDLNIIENLEYHWDWPEDDATKQFDETLLRIIFTASMFYFCEKDRNGVERLFTDRQVYFKETFGEPRFDGKQILMVMNSLDTQEGVQPSFYCEDQFTRTGELKQSCHICKQVLPCASQLMNVGNDVRTYCNHCAELVVQDGCADPERFEYAFEPEKCKFCPSLICNHNKQFKRSKNMMMHKRPVKLRKLAEGVRNDVNFGKVSKIITPDQINYI